MDDLDEVMATMDSDESFLVLGGHELRGSTRAELPPVRGSANEQELEETLRRGGGGWYGTSRDGKPFEPFDE